MTRLAWFVGGWMGLALLVGTWASCAAADEPAASAAISPTDAPIALFNGKNLDGFYVWLSDTKGEDPKQIFTVHDGLLHISGDGLGYLATRDRYRDYHLVCEFRFGPRTWGPRKDRTKDSGVLVHGVGEDGNAGAWMASHEAQIIEGGVGDFIVIGGKAADGTTLPMSLTAEVTKDRDGESVWTRGGTPQVFTRGRINWWGRDPDWQDVLGFRGRVDVESPDGQWTRLEVICDGGRITQVVNGVVVNEGYDAWPREGKILVQTEWAEMFVRRLELWPVGKAPRVQEWLPGFLRKPTE
jgi:hypothetical protein